VSTLHENLIEAPNPMIARESPKATVAIVSVPELVPLSEGRWQAGCQFCKTESIPVAATSAANAWVDLEKLGWVVYEAVPGAPLKALCKTDGEKNARIMGAVKAARKHRKRK
jgi:hypothetical protein